MSYEPYQQPTNYPPPKKDNTLKIVLIGLGCFGLMALLCLGGIGFTVYQGVQAVGQGIAMINENDGYLQAQEDLKNSKPLASVLGEPIEIGMYTNIDAGDAGDGGANGGDMRIEYELPVSGPKASGTATIVVEGPALTDKGWTIRKLEVWVDGELVPLDDQGLDMNSEDE